MIQPDAGGFCGFQRFTIHGDRIAGRHIQRGAGDLFAVDGHAPFFDQALGLAAAGAACAGDDFCNAVAIG